MEGKPVFLSTSTGSKLTRDKTRLEIGSKLKIKIPEPHLFIAGY